MTPRRVCFVTDELFPFSAGGIGRILHNLVRLGLERSSGTEFHFLVPDRFGVERERVRARFGDRVQIHYAALRSGWDATLEEGRIYPPGAAFTDSIWHAESLDLMRALRHLAESGLSFDVIEFPDYRGWAFCTLQEKLLGRGFLRSLVSVRLHSTDGVLQRFEPRPPTMEQPARFDLERKALHDAELVVAHLESIADFNLSYYGFDRAWREKVVTEFPPVAEVTGKAPSSELPPGRRDLLFATKLQPFKRPDVFIRGAVTFMRAQPDYRGCAVLSCHSFDESYARRVRALVPTDLAHRFRFSGPGPDRDALLGGSILVIPSAYESCNLTAYEAAALGSLLVLNGECLAFGEGSPFRDDVNCHKYDGTVEGLAAALGRAVRGPLLPPVAWNPDLPYFLGGTRRGRRRRRQGSTRRVSVVVTNFNLAHHLPETLASVASSTHRDLEVVIVDDGSSEELDAVMLERLEREAARDGAPLKVIRNPVNRGLPGARNIGIRAATGEYVLPLDADDCISPLFLEMAVRGLERCPEYDVVVPTAGYFRTDADQGERRFCDWAVFLGEATAIGLAANRFSCATSLMRRRILERFPYDESLESYEDWDLYLRLAHAGCRFLVTNDVQFHYRARPGSMIWAVSRDRHHAHLSRVLEKVPPGAPQVRLFPLVGAAAAAYEDGFRAGEAAAASPLAPPLRYRLVDMLNRSMKQAPIVHPALKKAALLAEVVVRRQRGA